MLDKGLKAFVQIFPVLKGKIETDLKNLNKLSTDPITEKNKFRLINHVSSMGVDFVLPVNDFIGTPIFAIRRWFVDRDVKKYKLLKEKKRLLELKILRLEAQKTGNAKEDSKLSKSIEYYQRVVDDLEYEIVRLEN